MLEPSDVGVKRIRSCGVTAPSPGTSPPFAVPITMDPSGSIEAALIESPEVVRPTSLPSKKKAHEPAVSEPSAVGVNRSKSFRVKEDPPLMPEIEPFEVVEISRSPSGSCVAAEIVFESPTLDPLKYRLHAPVVGSNAARSVAVIATPPGSVTLPPNAATISGVPPAESQPF